MRMSGRTRGETRAIQDLHHSIGLMSMSEHARLANQLANREAIDEVVREHGLPRIQLGLSTAHDSDPPALSTVAGAEALEHADICRSFRVDEFSGLLQAHTFAPA